MLGDHLSNGKKTGWLDYIGEPLLPELPRSGWGFGQSGSVSMSDEKLWPPWIAGQPQSAFYSGQRAILKMHMVDPDFPTKWIVSLQKVENTKPVFAFFPEWAMKHLVEGREVVALNHGLTFDGNQFIVDLTSNEVIIIFRPYKGGAIGEAYAGIGGWHVGLQALGAEPKVAIDHEPVVAEAYAKSHGYAMMSVTQAYDAMRNDDQLPERLVLLGDILDPRVWAVCSTYDIDTWVSSPPCPPWSGLSNQSGLASENGRLLTNFLLAVAITGGITVVMENVAPVARHKDFPTIKRLASFCGLPLILHNVESCEFLPTCRRRWLAIFHHHHSSISPVVFHKADAIKLPRPTQVEHDTTNIGKADAFHVNITDDEWETLRIPHECLEMMMDPMYLPPWEKTHNDITAEEALLKRIVTEESVFKAIVASYGKQHLMPQENLIQKGLHTFVIQQRNALRFASPWEFASALGFPPSLCLPHCKEDAWRITGNAITPIQAAKVLLRLHTLLQNKSPFCYWAQDLQRVTDSLFSSTIKLSEWQIEVVDGWDRLQVSLRALRWANDDILDTAMDEVTPTLPFEVPRVQPCDDHHAAQQQDVIKMHSLPHDSSFYDVETIFQQMRCFWDAEFKEDMGLQPCILMHGDRRTCSTLWIDAPSNILQLIQKFFLHIDDTFIGRVWCQSQETTLHAPVPARQPLHLVVDFCKRVGRIVMVPQNTQLLVEFDGTWTISDLKAVLGMKVGVLPTSIEISSIGYKVDDQDFVMEHHEVDFDMTITTISRDRAEAGVHQLQLEGYPNHSDKSCQVVPTSGMRFAVRHPTRGTVRTVAGVFASTVEGILQTLLPDFESQNMQVIVNNESVSKNVVTQDWTSKDTVWVEFCNGDFPMQQIFVLDNTQAYKDLHTEHLKQYWIRSPFTCRIQHIMRPSHWTLCEVAAAFFCQTNATQTLIVLVDGKHADPRAHLSDLPEGAAISIRSCALPGGAKKQATLRDKVKEALIAHGVPSSCADARMQQVIHGIGFDQLQPHELEDDFVFWDSMKRLANNAKVRLVTHVELKDFQKWKRTNTTHARSSDDSFSRGKKDRSMKRKLDVTEFTFKQVHFTANDGDVDFLSAERFGPDQTGVAIMDVEDAKIKNPHGVISPEPLAILAIGHEAHQVGQKQMIPAFDREGLPVLIPGALIQCGDVEVQYIALAPSATVEAVHATTVEVLICRDFIKEWDSASNAMNFLGVQISELRGPGKILSAWSMKTYKKRKGCEHRDADSWHGFIRLPDHLLDACLKRSGMNGIFLTPKSNDKRGDPRYGVVSMPGMKLDDIIKKVTNVKEALGIALINRDPLTFAVRGKKEDVCMLRGVLYPESLQIEQTPVDEDEELYTLRYVQDQFTSTLLTAALQQAGWEAKAVRPAGSQSWIVASRKQPPASHLCINGALVVVVPMRKGQNAVPVVMTRANQTTQVVDKPDGTTVTTRHSRIDELRADIHGQVASIVDQKMQVAETRIQELTLALERTQEKVVEIQAEQQLEIMSIKEQQNRTEQKVGVIETTVQASTNTILSQMQEMFGHMQKESAKQIEDLQTTVMTSSQSIRDEFESRVATIEREQIKRVKHTS